MTKIEEIGREYRIPPTDGAIDILTGFLKRNGYDVREVKPLGCWRYNIFSRDSTDKSESKGHIDHHKIVTIKCPELDELLFRLEFE